MRLSLRYQATALFAICLAICSTVLCPGFAVAQEEPATPGVRRVYVPVDQLDAILAKNHNGVMMPNDDFETLFELATKNTTDQPRLPATSLITKCEYDTEFGEQQLVLNATVTFTQFVDGWRAIRFPIRGISVEAATLDGEPAKLGRAAQQPVAPKQQKAQQAVQQVNDLILFSQGKGTKELKLTLSAPLAAVGSDKVAAFGLIVAPSATLNVKVPGERHLYVNDLMPKRPDDIEEETSYSIAVGGQASVRLRLTQQQGNQTSDALVFATTAYGLDVAPGEVTWNAVTDLQLFGRTIDSFKFDVPSSLEIADVKSIGLESWDLADSDAGADQTTITLNYRQPVDESRRVEFRGIMSTPAGSAWTVPGLTVNNANSHVGRILVRYPLGTRLLVNDSTGVRATVAAASENSGPQFIYDIWQEDFRLSFITQNRAREVFADLSTIVEAKDTGIELETLATLQCINAPLFELEVVIPADWTVTGFTIDDKAVTWKSVPREAGENHLLIELPQPLKPGASLSAKLVARRDIAASAGGPPLVAAAAGLDQGFEFQLPEIRLPQSNVVEGAYLVTADEDLEIIPGEVTGLDATQLDYPRHHLGYRYQDTRFSGTMMLKRRVARVAARTASYSRIDRDKLRTHFDCELDITGGGTRSLKVQLPDWSDANLRFRITKNCQPPVRIVSQSVGDPQNGQSEWTVQFDRHAKGLLTISTDVESPRTDSGVADVPTVGLPNVDRHNGFVAIEGSGEQQISVSFDPGIELPHVDPVDLPATQYVPKERIVAAHRFVQPNFAISLSENRFDRMAVPTAVVHQLTIQSVLAETGDFQHQADVDFVAVGVQSLRLLLPPEADLWSVIIDGRPIEVRKTDDAFLISLPRLASLNRADSHRSLKLVYSTLLKEMQLYGRIQHEPPAFAVEVEDGDAQPIETLQQHWTVSYPDGTALVASDGRFQPVSGALDRPGLLVQVRDLIQMPRLQDARSLTWLLVVIVAVVFLAAVAIRRLGTGTGTGVVLLLLIIGSFVWLMGQSLDSRRVVSGIAANDARVDDESFTEGMDLAGGTDLVYQEAEKAKDAAEISEESPQDGKPRNRALKTNDPFGESEEQDVRRSGQQLELSRPNATPAPNAPPKKGRTGGGRLSVDVELQYPENQTQQTFQYNGTAMSGTGPAMDIAWFNRDAGVMIRAVVMAGIALLLWWFRSTPLGLRWFLAVIGLVIPMGLLTLSPPVFDYVLDGVFLGTLVGLFLWLVRSAVRLCARCCGCCLPSNWKRTTATMMVVAAASQSLSVQAADKKTQAAVQQPTVIVPYNADEPALDAKRVFIPHEQFQKWWNAAYPDRQKHAPPNVAGVVSAAQFNAKLLQTSDTEGSVSVTGRIVLDSFRDEQITLDLPLGVVALDKATMDGEPAAISVRQLPQPVSANANQQRNAQRQNAPVVRSVYQVVIDKPGTHVLDLQFELPARLTGPSGQFTIPLRSVPMGRLSFELPSEDLAVRVNGSSSAFRLKSSDDQPTIELPTGQGGDVTVSWQPQQERGVNDSVVHVASTTAVIVDDTGLQVQAKFNYAVRQGTLSEVAFNVPADLQLKKVTGADVGGWESNGEGNQRSLKVFLRRSVEKATSISVELYRNIDIADTKSINLPNFAANNVTRETGTMGLFVGGQFSVRPGKVSGVSQINSDTFRADKGLDCPSHAPQFAWKFSARPISIEAKVLREEAETNVTANHAARIELRKVRWTSLFAFRLKGAPRSRVGIRLPEKLVPLNVEAGGLVDWYIHTSDDGDRILVVEFSNPRIGSAEVTLSAFLPRDASIDSLSLNVPTPVDVKQLHSQLAIWTDSLYSASIIEDDGWKNLLPQQLPNQMRALQKKPANYAYESKSVSPSTVNIELQRMKPELNGHAVTVVTASDFSVEYSMNLKWDIPTAAADTFVFTTTDQFSGRIEFQVPGLRSVEETSIEGEDRIRWIITLQEPVATSFYALATVTQPPPEDVVTVPVISFENKNNQQEYQPLETQDHIVLLSNQSTGQLAQEDPDAAKAATPTDLKVNIPEQILQKATEMAWVKDQPLRWSITRFRREDSTPASVNLADVKTIVAADGTYRTQAIYTMRNRSRQFLPLIIPDKCRLISVFVGNKPTRPVTTTNDRKQTLHLIALPKTSAADLSFAVRVVLSGALMDELSGGLKAIGEDVRIPLPTIPGLKDDPEFGIPTARTVWNLHLPESWDGSLIDESGRSNVAFSQDGGIVDDLYVLNSIKEANRIAEQFEKDFTGQSQRLALTNINSVNQWARRYRNSENNPEIADELKRLGDNVTSINGRVQLDTNGNGIVIINNGTIDVNTNDEISINNYNYANNKMLFMGNSDKFDINMGGEDYDESKSTGGKRFSFGLSDSEQEFQKESESRQRSSRKKSLEKPTSGNAKGSRRSSLSQLNDQIQRRGESFKAPARKQGQGISNDYLFGNSATPSDYGGNAADSPFNSVSGNGGQQAGQMGGGGYGGFGGGGGREGGGMGAAGLGGMPQPGFGANGPGSGNLFNAPGQDFEANLPGLASDKNSPNQAPDVSFGTISRDSLPAVILPQTGTATGDQQIAQGIVTQPWTRAGGLSLPIELPVQGKQLTFTKVSGNPMLTLRVRPRAAKEFGFSLAWAIAWGVVGIFLLVSVRTKELMNRRLPWLFAMAGILSMYFLDNDFTVLGFALFLVAIIWLAVNFVRQPTIATR